MGAFRFKSDTSILPATAEYLDKALAGLSNFNALEFGTGAGLATEIIAKHAKSLTTIDNSRACLEYTRGKLQSLTNIKYVLGYNPELLGQDKFDFLFIDGPPGSEPRQHVLIEFWDSIKPGALILLDDANRGGEQEMLEHWQKKWGIQYKIIKIGRGIGSLKKPYENTVYAVPELPSDKLSPIVTSDSKENTMVESKIYSDKPLPEIITNSQSIGTKPPYTIDERILREQGFVPVVETEINVGGKPCAVLCNTKMFGGGERSALKMLQMLRTRGLNVKGYSLTPDENRVRGMEEFSRDWRCCEEKHQVWVMNDKIYSLQNEELFDFIKVTGFASDIRIVCNFVIGGFSKNGWLSKLPIKKVIFLNRKKQEGWIKDCDQVNKRIPTGVLPPPVDINRFLNFNGVKETIKIGSHGGKCGEHYIKVLSHLDEKYKGKVSFHFLPGHSDLKKAFQGNRNFHFYSKVSGEEAVAKYLDSLDIYIYHMKSGVHTQGPRTVMEALAVGKPVVTDNCQECGMRDRVLHQETGFLCNNAQDYIDYISRLIERPNLRNTMSNSARESAKQFKPERWLDSLI